ncbi:hypothetical protein AB1N83_010669 [Pleurotus pulmonarius]
MRQRTGQLLNMYYDHGPALSVRSKQIACAVPTAASYPWRPDVVRGFQAALVDATAENTSVLPKGSADIATIILGQILLRLNGRMGVYIIDLAAICSTQYMAYDFIYPLRSNIHSPAWPSEWKFSSVQFAGSLETSPTTAARAEIFKLWHLNYSWSIESRCWRRWATQIQRSVARGSQ